MLLAKIIQGLLKETIQDQKEKILNHHQMGKIPVQKVKIKDPPKIKIQNYLKVINLDQKVKNLIQKGKTQDLPKVKIQVQKEKEAVKIKMDKNKRMENQMVKTKRIKIASQNLKAEKDI